MPLAAEYVGTGYDTGEDPVSGLANIANGPAISKLTGYVLSISLLLIPRYVRLVLLAALIRAVRRCGHQTTSSDQRTTEVRQFLSRSLPMMNVQFAAHIRVMELTIHPQRLGGEKFARGRVL
jgi:hypothetical protein